MGSGYAGGRPDVEWWLGEIRRGIEYRKKMACETSWNRWRGYYRGQWPRNTLPVNLFFRMLRTVVPRIYFRNPSISVMPAKPGAEMMALAQLVERIDNKLIRSMKMKNQIKQIIQQTWMFGTGVGKRGFAQEFLPGDIVEEGAPDTGQGRFRQKVEYNPLVQENMPWFMRVSTGDFILPAGAVTFESARWHANRIKRPKWDVNNDPRLKGAKDLSGMDKSFDLFGHSSVEMVDMYEIHDKATGKVMVLSPQAGAGHKALIFADDRTMRNNRTCYYPLVFNDDDECFWGIPDSVVLEPQQHEINEIRTLEMKHRRLAIMKLLYKKDTIDITQLEKLLNGEVMAGVEVKGELSDIDTIQLADIPQSLRIQAQEVLNDVRESMGFSRNQAGEFSTGTSNPPTATEAQIVQVASEIRVDERRDMTADMLVDVFEDVNVDVFETWKEEQVVQVMGPNSVPVWVIFKPEMLKAGQYNIKIDPDTSVPETKEIRMNKALVTYERLKTNPLIDPELLTKYLLHELHGVQFDNMLRTMQQNAAAGAPGATSDRPLQVPDYIRLVAGAQAGS